MKIVSPVIPDVALLARSAAIPPPSSDVGRAAAGGVRRRQLHKSIACDDSTPDFNVITALPAP
jgi:hypothetical protein